MKSEEIILDEIRNRCAKLQALIHELRSGSPDSMDEKSIAYLEKDLKKIKKEIHGKVYDYRLAQLEKEIEEYDV
jgi:hypothetical protein